MIRKIAIILSSLSLIIGLAYIFLYVDLNSDPEKSIRNLLSEKFARDCLQDVKSNDFLYNQYITRNSRNEFLGQSSSNKNNVNKIPDTITLKEFLEIKPALVRNSLPLRILPISSGSVNSWPNGNIHEDWEYTFEHEDFEFKCFASIKLETGLPITEGFDFEVLRTAK